MRQKRPIRSILLRLLLLFGVALAALPATQPNSVAYAQTGTITLRVESARAWAPSGLPLHQAIPSYTWVIVRDDTGETDPHYGTRGGTTINDADFACRPQSLGGDPAYPENCRWPSIQSSSGGVAGQIVYQGNETQLNQSTGIALPDGKYMISVLADGMDVPGCIVTATVTCHVDGFKIDGQWFTVNSAPQLVTVDAQPYPLPLTTVRLQVFEDTSANGEYDTGEPVAGMGGFEGHISDVLGVVTTDWYGNPLCTKYEHDGNGNIIFDGDGAPTILQTGGHCYADPVTGIITIPYLGPNRYSATVVPPNGQQWVQYTSLEGGLDWDIWAQEGWNGNEAEFVNQTEAFPFAMFGFVKPTFLAGHPDTPINSNLSVTGEIKGTAINIRPYTPTTNGIPFGVEAGNGIAGPMDRPEVTLVSIDAGDIYVWQGRGNPDGTFDIKHVPDGIYLVSIVDQPENFLVESSETIVSNGQVDDMGVLDQFPWFAHVKGRVCNDLNRNGKCEAGEPGIAGMHVTLLSRDNSLQDQGSADAATDVNGNYDLNQAYPLGQWVVSQVYDERFYTTGVTYQTENQPTETTVMANGGFVDVSTFNLVGLQTREDWALHRYETDPSLGPTNGGIVGTVWYAATRNETDARFQANEDYEAGIPGLPMHLYAPIPCDPDTNGALCVATSTPAGTAYYMTNADGSYARGNELAAPYITETWKRPVNCTARDVNGEQVVEQVLPPPTGGHDCLEAFLMSNQVGDNSQADAHGDTGNGQLVNGNYGFTAGCFQVDTNGDVVFDDNGNPVPGASDADGNCTSGTMTELPPWDYIVAPEIPTNPITGKPLFEVAKEEDINVYTGDEFVAPGETPVNPPTPVQPQAVPQPTPQVPPFLCTGSLHTVHVVDTRAAALYDPNNPFTTSGVYNPGWLAAGGSPFEGQQMPLCNSRMVTVQRGKSATPNFHFFTDTPLPGRLHGMITDDLNTSSNPRELFYGEKAGIPNIPIGIYDFSNRLVTTIHTDVNGVYETILPSTSSYNCPLPAGPCPGVYRLIANDPGQPPQFTGDVSHLNPDYNPQYRTLSVMQQVWPNLSLPTDLAPVPASYFVESPGSQTAHMPQCLLNDPATTAPRVPELYAVSKPLVRTTDTGANRNITINGQYFGASPGTVTLDNFTLPIVSWNANGRQIVVSIPTVPTIAAGPHQLKITGSNGQSTINGLTFHVLGGTGSSAYNPTVIEVGPGRAFDPTAAIRNTGGYEHALQDALNTAAANTANKLVIVYPGPQSTFNPFGAYFENIVIRSPVKLQGVGPGGVYSDGSSVVGSVLDGTGFGQDDAKSTAWETLVGGLTFVQPTTPPEFMPYGQVVTVVSQTGPNRPFGATYRASIDGLHIRGGDVGNAPPNLNDNGGGPELSLFGPLDPIFQAGVSQGGGIFAYAGTQNLLITNNVLKNNGGAYGGAIRLGTPYAGDNILDNIRIGNNQIVANGGSNLAGQVGIFAGADGYEVDHNEICGGFSAEYGGGISHFGLNGTGTGGVNKIHDNRIYFNGSYDEGAGVIVAGELPTAANRLTAPGSLPAPPAGMSPGAGPVDVYNNILQSNLSGDDGGGLRFLMAGNYPYNVYNNIIANNISTHEGGGVALDDTPNVRFYNNTVVKNITTATSVSSTGLPAAAGLSSITNSDLLQTTLPAGSPNYSNPLMFNDIFCDNRAGSWDGANIVGIGYTNVAGQTDPNPINYWDLGLDGPGLFQPTFSILQPQPTTNPGLDPAVRPPAGNNQACPASLASLFRDPTYNTSLLAFPWRGDAHFVGNVIIAQDVPPSIMGDYHLANSSTIANNAGAASKALPTYQQPPATRTAPTTDIEGDARPSFGGFEIGADEIGPAALAFPFTGVLDNFNRAGPALGSNWLGNTSTASYSIFSSTQARVQGTGGYVYWNPTSFGSNQEAYFTFTKLSPIANVQSVFVKANGLSTTGTGFTGSNPHVIAAEYDPTVSGGQVRITTYASGQNWVTRATFNGVTFGVNDQLGIRALSDGTVIVFKNGASIGSTNVTTGPTPWPTAFASGGGRVGAWFIKTVGSATGFASPNDARFDNFGGGTLP